MKKHRILILGSSILALVIAIVIAIIIKNTIFSDTTPNDTYLIQLDGSAIKKRKIASTSSYLIRCDGNVKGGVQYVNLKRNRRKDDPAFLSIDGVLYALSRTLSASGERYADDTGNFVFWTKGNSALIMENDVPLYEEACTLTATPWDTVFTMIAPDSGHILTMVGNLSAPTLDITYFYDQEGMSYSTTYTLYPEKRTVISKVGDIHNEHFVVLPLTVITQGTGVFWYAVLFHKNLAQPSVYTYLDAYYLGDRIENVHIEDDIGIMNISFDDYAPGQPYSDTPSEPTVLILGIDIDTKKLFLISH